MMADTLMASVCLVAQYSGSSMLSTTDWYISKILVELSHIAKIKSASETHVSVCGSSNPIICMKQLPFQRAIDFGSLNGTVSVVKHLANLSLLNDKLLTS